MSWTFAEQQQGTYILLFYHLLNMNALYHTTYSTKVFTNVPEFDNYHKKYTPHKIVPSQKQTTHVDYSRQWYIPVSCGALPKRNLFFIEGGLNQKTRHVSSRRIGGQNPCRASCLAARILSPNPMRRPLPCLLIQSFYVFFIRAGKMSLLITKRYVEMRRCVLQ